MRWINARVCSPISIILLEITASSGKNIRKSADVGSEPPAKNLPGRAAKWDSIYWAMPITSENDSNPRKGTLTIAMLIFILGSTIRACNALKTTRISGRMKNGEFSGTPVKIMWFTKIGINVPSE